MVEVNLKEMAGRVRCSLPTMSAMVDRYEGFPVIERGGMGRAWKFDAGEVINFLRAKREEQEASEAARDEELAQLTLPIMETAAAGAKELTVAERLAAAKLRAVEREEARDTRFLVRTDEVRTALEKALRRYSQAETSALDRVMKKHNLPEAVRRALEMEFAEARTAFVRDAGEFLVKPEVDDEQFALQA